MKKIGILYREKIIEQFTRMWSDSPARIFISFSKVNAFGFNRLRNELKKNGSSLLVSKNSLIKKAFVNLAVDGADDFIDGSCGIVFIKTDDIANICKILFNFSKDNEGLVLKGGFLNNDKIDSAKLIEISRLPARDVVMTQALMGIAAPLSGFVAVLNNIILKFVWVVEELKSKKSGKE